MTLPLGRARVDQGPVGRTDGASASVLCALRTLVGVGTWASPAASWRLFGLGRLEDDPGGALVGRLFGVRDLALARSVRHPSPEVRRAGLTAGVACDAVDVVATLLALRRGGSRTSGVLVGGGAALFVVLGLVGLRAERSLPSQP